MLSVRRIGTAGTFALSFPSWGSSKEQFGIPGGQWMNRQRQFLDFLQVFDPILTVMVLTQKFLY